MAVAWLTGLRSDHRWGGEGEGHTTLNHALIFPGRRNEDADWWCFAIGGVRNDPRCTLLVALLASPAPFILTVKRRPSAKTPDRIVIKHAAGTSAAINTNVFKCDRRIETGRVIEMPGFRFRLGHAPG